MQHVEFHVSDVKKTKTNFFPLSSRGGLEGERLLHKLHDSVAVDQSLLGACMSIFLTHTKHFLVAN